MLMIFALEISMNKYTFNIFAISQLIDSSFVSNRSFFGNCTIYMYNNKWIEKNHTSSQFSSQTCFDTFVLDYSRKFLAIFLMFWLKKQKKIWGVEKNAHIFYVQVWLIWQFLIRSNSHPSMAFTERFASLDKESFSFEVLFA